MTQVTVLKRMGTAWPAIGETMAVADGDVALMVAAGYVELTPEPAPLDPEA